ncbi:CRISPR-associated protein (TIGR03986 family) [Kordia periserrulae]|uniref:CRISPR-associated protein (TIGR03986 family) n=1 Tax=Kordia periserrulae TaxID=701523 RepID=A0A2T6BUS6_9FLAO|nr:TIGR03986 family CRISPR-associated RAMP protein [Kordia periserrulae]PTX59814.1 CRISPR-associated protein (TIGR03986 family) [Kordia periserrulae]
MSTVTSAYNFVPINKEVCLPDWADYVSQDIPLQGALSGEIDLTITAKTPIFVRGKSTVSNPNAHQEYEFMKHNDQYCIPGSSIKGTIANVLEIISFGKLNRINDHRFSQRDWNNEKIYDKQSFAQKNKGGWLYFEGETYKIDYNTAQIGRIEHKEIDAYFKTNFVELFGENFDQKIPGENKSALRKYKLLKDRNLKVENKLVELRRRHRHEQQRYKIQPDITNGASGTIVFSGQSSERKEVREGVWKGKNKEFIFWEPNVKKKEVPKQVMKDFFFAYYEDDSKKRTTDWEHWRKVLANGERVPVFLQLDEKDNIKHFGLSMLYKLPFDQRVKELLKGTHHEKKQYDFVETLFGYSIEKESSKGRVSFQHAFAEGFVKECKPKTLVLGEPKASYYPFYIPQEFIRDDSTIIINGEYITYNDDVPLAGRKRYPIKKIDDSLGADESAFSTTFKPLPAGTTFKSKIVYHNLLPEELGALLCALTFNGVENCHHGIGMAKPYGYGAVAIDIMMYESVRNKAMMAFRTYMESWWIAEKLEGTWSESEQLQELIAMARFSHQSKKLTYMELTDFPQIIKEQKALPRFTQFLGIEPHNYSESYQKEINAFIEIEKERLAAIEEAERLKKEAEEKAKAEAAEAEKEANAAKERQENLAKGLFEWLPKTNDYGLIADKMDKWIDMRNEECITDTAEINYVLLNVTASRKKKPSRHRERFFNEKKTNDLIRWIGKEETEKFIQSFTNES